MLKFLPTSGRLNLVPEDKPLCQSAQHQEVGSHKVEQEDGLGSGEPRGNALVAAAPVEHAQGQGGTGRRDVDVDVIALLGK